MPNSIQPKNIAKKHFSQNFLQDEFIKNRISETLRKLIEDRKNLKIVPPDKGAWGYKELILVEIGPGLGDVTEICLSFGLKLIALEIDDEVIEVLKDKFTHNSNFYLQLTDAYKLLQTGNLEEFLATVLGLTLAEFKSKHDWLLVSSLPYHVGSRILVEMGIYHPEVTFGVILQKEVAQKTIMNPKSFSLFGAYLNLFWDFQIAFTIPPHAFIPQPKVHSSFLVARPKVLPKNLESVTQRQNTLTILKKLFISPNKTLINNLKNLDFNKSQIDEFMMAMNLPIETRLTPENYVRVLEGIGVFIFL